MVKLRKEGEGKKMMNDEGGDKGNKDKPIIMTRMLETLFGFERKQWW